MFQLYVQVQRNVAPVNLVTVLVRTREVLLDLNRQPPIFLPVLQLIKPVVLFCKSL